MPEEGVVFAAAQPLYVFLGLTAVLVPLRTCLDAVLLDGLLGFLDGTAEVSLA